MAAVWLRNLWIGLLGLLCWQPAVVVGADDVHAGFSRLVLDAGVVSIPFGNHMDVLEDPGATLSIEDVVKGEAAAHFVPHRNPFPNWGATRSAYWYRALLVNPQPWPQPIVIEQTSSWIDHMGLYLPEEDDASTFRLLADVGDAYPFEQRPIRHHDYLFKLVLQPGQQMPVFIRIQSRTATATPITVWTPDAYHEHDRHMAYYFGAYFGVLAIMAFYNLFLLFTLRDAAYFYYVLFICALGLMYLNSSGFSFMYFWGDDPDFSERIQTAAISFYEICTIVFAVRFFDTGRSMPQIHRLLRFVVLFHAVLIGCAFGVADVTWVINVIISTVTINSPILLFVGIVAWRRGNPMVRYYLLGWSSSIIGLAVTGLTLFNVFNYNFFLHNAAFLGALVDVTFLSFALADRINVLRAEKAAADRRVQQALLQAKEELEQKVEERTADLRAAKEEADHANQVKSRFLSRMSHELRTPLNAILGFAQLLRTDKNPQLSAGQQDSVAQILFSGRHLLTLINDILDLSRIEAGKISINTKSVSIRAVIDNVLQLVGEIATSENIQIQDKTPPGEFCFVSADPTRLTQVLINLVSNAIKYNRPGGSVCLEAEREGGRLRIKVADTGVGLSGEQMKNLFQPFERLDSDRRGIEGTGIGLSISKEFMELMGGSIGVHSMPGDGATFYIDLPESAMPSTPAVTLTDDAAMEYEWVIGAGSVLYVEDNPINRKLMQHLFNRVGQAQLTMAECGEEGLRQARALRPQLIILDINLPDLSGYEVLAELRGDPLLRDIPVVAVSADVSPESVERGLAAGFLAYLHKPVDFNELMGLLEDRLGA